MVAVLRLPQTPAKTSMVLSHFRRYLYYRYGSTIEFHLRTQAGLLSTSAPVKGCRTPAAYRRRRKLGRQVSDKPQGRKPRAGYAEWCGFLWGKCDRSAWLDRTVRVDTVVASRSRRASKQGENIFAVAETVDGSSRPSTMRALGRAAASPVEDQRRSGFGCRVVTIGVMKRRPGWMRSAARGVGRRARTSRR